MLRLGQLEHVDEASHTKEWETGTVALVQRFDIAAHLQSVFQRSVPTAQIDCHRKRPINDLHVTSEPTDIQPCALAAGP